MELIILLFIAVLATFAGGELIGKVPPSFIPRSCQAQMPFQVLP